MSQDARAEVVFGHREQIWRQQSAPVRDVGDSSDSDRDSTAASVTLTQAEAIALAGVLAGVFVDVEIEDDVEPIRG